MPNYRYKQGDRPLDGYKIQYALGRGGFGEVYFGTSDSGREVALKAVQNYEDVELRGISHCMNLKSPHLVTIFDVRYGEGNVPWVIMEYVSGPSLHELLAEADIGIGADQAMYFARELISGLRYLHDAGVVHRDLKPHNIFFEDGTVKIGDYSLSKAISSSQQTGHTTTVGSVHYMAPEIGEGKYDKAVDIYALGVILFEMLTGSPPYVGESMGEVLIKHLTSEPDISEIKQPFADVIKKSMRRDPEKRFQSVDQMLTTLCPEDHSSYLPAPSSLTMIGDQAIKRRSAKRQSNQSHSVNSELEDTFLPGAALIDTKENKPSDSLPFSRPGIPKPKWQWLMVLGLWWRPNLGTQLPSDAVAFIWRSVLAAACCIAIGFFGILLDPVPGNKAIQLVGMLGVVAAVLTWSMLQFLPRSDQLKWAILSRLLTTGIWLGIGFAFANLASEFFNLRLFDDDMFLGLLGLGFLVDWRCHLSVDRYPRVGVIRTIVALIAFVSPVFFDGPFDLHDEGGLMSIAFVAAAVVSIQVLSPMHRMVTATPEEMPTNRGLKEALDEGSNRQTQVDPGVQVLQEKI
jgi:serine/threonine protein kinase